MGCVYSSKCPRCQDEYLPERSEDLSYIVDPLKASVANKMLDCISKQLIRQIKEFLDTENELEFSERLNLHVADQTIDGIFKRDNEYHIASTDNKSAEGLFYDLDGVEILVQDLTWIMEQIEIYKRG